MNRRSLPSRLAGLAGVSLFCEIGYALATTFALPLYLRDELRWVEKDVGPVISAFMLAETAAKPLWGHLSDRIGRKPLILLGILISVVAVLAMAGTTGRWEFIVLSGLNGIGAGALWPAVFASVADTTSDDERVKSMSVFNMMYMVGLGGGAIVGSRLFEVAALPHHIFYYTAGLFLLGLASGAGFIPWIKGHAAKAKSLALHGPGVRANYLVLAFFMTLSFFQTLGLQVMNGSLVFYLTRDLGLDRTRIGWPFIVLAAVIAVLAIPVGAAGGRWGRVRSARAGLGLASAGMLLLPLRQDTAWFLAIAVPMIVGFLLSIPAWLAIITELAPMEWRGRVFGLVTTAQGLGAVLGPAVGTWFYSEAGHASPFFVSGGVLMLTFVASLIWLRENMRAVIVLPVPGGTDWMTR